MGRSSTVIPVGADGLIDEAALGCDPRRRAGAGRDPAGQQRDRGDPAARPPCAAHSRGRVAAARRLRAERRQAAASRRRFHRRLRPQARRSAGHRRAAGPRLGDARARSAGRRRAIAAARRMRRMRWPSPRRWPRGRTTWSGWRRCGRGSRTASKAAGGVVIAEDEPADPDDRRLSRCPARRARRCSCSSILPASRCRREAPAHPAAMKGSAVLAAMGVAPRKSPAASSGSASGPARARPTSTASSPNGGGSPSVPPAKAA